MDLAPSPPPVPIGERLAVPVDVERVSAGITFDVAGQTATVAAIVHFTMEHYDGCPVLDLRQPVDSIRLDGRGLDPASFPQIDLGGGPGAEMRLLDRVLPGGSHHRLELGYGLEAPAAAGAEPIGWTDSGVRFDFWLSDLHPGRYLEMWLPANLCHDRFQLHLDVSVVGGAAHTVVTNGASSQMAANQWRIDYPAAFTSLSPMLVVRPDDEIELRRRQADGREVVTAKVSESDADLAACEADIVAWLAHNERRYGTWVHGPRFTAVLWGPGRGMEYDGATTASVGALEHEVFHSWFGRGIKPACAGDGWIDEAFTSWATASRRRELPRFHVEELGLEEPPVVLYPPHPWSRHTPVESYASGSRLFAGIAYRLGGAPQLREKMAGLYRERAGAFVSTDELQRELNAEDLFARYVHGRG
jgi:hypothetical protein